MRPLASTGITIVGIIMIMPITATPMTITTMVRTENTSAIERWPGSGEHQGRDWTRWTPPGSKESSPLWMISQATIPFAEVHALLALFDYYSRDTYAPCRCSPPLQAITPQRFEP